jgi:hypothetical protein
MFRYVLCFTFAVSFATAATIGASATCDGVTTVGTFSASCGNDFLAVAGVSQTSVSVSAVFMHSASASFSDDFVFTVFGGTGAGSFVPCLSAMTGSDAMVAISFGGVGFGLLGFETNETCRPNFPFGQLPFTFGVPQIVHSSLEGDVFPSGLHGSGFGSASFDGIQFFDPAGNLLSNVTFTLVEVPEPSPVSLLIMGLIFLSGGIRCSSMFSVSHSPPARCRRPSPPEVDLATAATISTLATCDRVTTVGTTSANCGDINSSAQTLVQITGLSFDVSVQAAIAPSAVPPSFASSSASFSGYYAFTLFGGTGEGFFYPCFEARSPSHLGGVMGGGSFDGVGFSFLEAPFVTNCNGGPDNFHNSKPFTYGVPQIVPFSMDATAVINAPTFDFFDEQADESFIGFAFFDPAGNPLSNITFTLVEVPEPTAWSLLSIGLMCFLAVRIRRMRFRGRFHGCDVR